MNDSALSMPAIRIEVNGSLLQDSLVALLSAVHVQQRLGLPAQIELTFSDSVEHPGLPARLAPGSQLNVCLGRFGEAFFDGDITALEWRYGSAQRRELVVRGYDPLYRLGQRQSLRAFADLTPADLARRLAGEIGLAVSAPLPGPRSPRLYQHRQSDLALLQDMTGRCGLYPIVRGATLHLASLAGDDSDLLLRLGENLVEAHVELNTDASCHSLRMMGWDPQRSVAVEARASQTRLKDLVPGQAGPQSGDGREGLTLPDETAADIVQADAFAQAELDRRQAARVVFRGLAEGSPSLQPGRSIRLEGLADGLNGRYVLTQANHSIDARRGFVSRLSTQPPEPPPRERAAVATLGVVLRVDDPDQYGRVRVTLPAYGNVETDWIGVLSVAAGPGKGLVALPNRGDTVLVLLVHQDPSQAVVLGGLYGQERVTDSGVENGAVTRFSLRTADGQLIQLDDRSLKLQNRAGSFVELSPDRLHIFSQTPLTIEAPGNSVLIRAGLIDFEQG
jgi:phage baseplate assembly protein gpV/phage protein D